MSIVSPAAGATFKAGAAIQINADAFDENGNGTIARVEFFEGGNKIGESTQAPFFATWVNVAAGSYTVTATATDASGLATTSAPVGITVLPVAPGDLIISEFRFRGSAGSLDEFVELYNNTDYAIIVSTTDGSSGWSLASSGGGVKFTVPNGTIIPARGNYLGVNSSAYSLGTYATGDAAWTGSTGDGAGIALFKSSAPANFTEGNRLDAVGFSRVPDTRFREGAGIQPTDGVSASAEFSFVRRLNGGVPKDTNDNAADFLFISTDAITSGGVQSVLGAPGPESLTSPFQRNSTLPITLLDPAAASSQPPNRVRDLTSDPANNSTFGTLSIRRTITNNTGVPVTRLRFRVIDITTFPAPSGTVDLRARSSSAIQVTRADGSVVTVQGTTVEVPPVQPKGGGFNTTLAVETVTLSEPLQPGATIHVQFLLGLQQTGSFRFFINVEALQ